MRILPSSLPSFLPPPFPRQEAVGLHGAGFFWRPAESAAELQRCSLAVPPPPPAGGGGAEEEEGEGGLGEVSGSGGGGLGSFAIGWLPG